jgi:hypothetical protein
VYWSLLGVCPAAGWPSSVAQQETLKAGIDAGCARRTPVGNSNNHGADSKATAAHNPPGIRGVRSRVLQQYDCQQITHEVLATMASWHLTG